MRIECSNHRGCNTNHYGCKSKHYDTCSTPSLRLHESFGYLVIFLEVSISKKKIHAKHTSTVQCYVKPKKNTPWTKSICQFVNSKDKISTACFCTTYMDQLYRSKRCDSKKMALNTHLNNFFLFYIEVTYLGHCKSNSTLYYLLIDYSWAISLCI